MRITAALLAALALAAPAFGEVRYVSANLTTGNNDGTSWANAYRGADALTRALTAAVSGDELWVAHGTYKPALSGGSRNATFTLKPGVTLYGNFTGTETALSQRATVRPSLTILSGDLADNDLPWPSLSNRTDNSFNVVTASGSSTLARTLDGFTVQSGLANGPAGGFTARGGGIVMFSSATATIRNTTIRWCAGSFGGGAYMNGATATWEDCVLQFNNGGGFGGGCDMAAANATWTRCQFLDNTAARAGGLEVFSRSTVTVDSCLFARNTSTNTSAVSTGGALWVGSDGANAPNVTVRNTTMVANTSPGANGPGIVVSTTAPTAILSVRNSIVWGNTGTGASTQVSTGAGVTVQYSLLQNGAAGTGVLIGTDPQFVNAAAGDYRLSASSPAIDAGDNGAAGAGTLDLDRSPRRVDDARRADTGSGASPVIDLGAFEHQPRCTSSDVAGAGQVVGADGLLTADDIIVFIAWFFASDARADVASTGQVPQPDGQFSADDIIVFVNRYFAGC